MEKVVDIEGKKIGLRASAGTVRAYRDIFGSDLIVDMSALENEILGSKTLSVDSAKIAENAVYLMALEFDSELPPIEEWLNQFSPYFIYSAVVHAINMWHENTMTINKSKKN